MNILLQNKLRILTLRVLQNGHEVDLNSHGGPSRASNASDLLDSSSRINHPTSRPPDLVLLRMVCLRARSISAANLNLGFPQLCGGEIWDRFGWALPSYFSGTDATIVELARWCRDGKW